MITSVIEKQKNCTALTEEMKQKLLSIHANKKLSDDDFNFLYELSEKIAQSFFYENEEEESYYITLENNTKYHFYRLIVKASITENEIRYAIRQAEIRIRNEGIPAYNEYVDFIMQKASEKNKWKIEKLGESVTLERV